MFYFLPSRDSQVKTAFVLHRTMRSILGIYISRNYRAHNFRLLGLIRISIGWYSLLFVKKKGKNNLKKELKKILSIILIISLLFLLTSCISSGSSGSSRSATCKSCGRSFQAGDSAGNFMNIARTGMCNNCYNNFKTAQSALGR